MTTSPFPDPSLVLLVGASGSGKSTWAGARYRPEEIVSSDELRSRLGSGPADLEVSSEAFAVLETIASTRIARGLTTVVDTLGFDEGLRSRLLASARQQGMSAYAVVFRTPAATCRERNRRRTRPVPAAVLTGQIRRMAGLDDDLVVEGWSVLEIAGDGDAGGDPEPSTGAPPAGHDSDGIAFHLQVSRFPTEGSLGEWVDDLGGLAEDVGFAGVSVMDHLVQIPQVGREWEPMPEALGLLARFGAATRHARLGALVSPVTFRHPVVLARELATLDALTDGRVDCGLGAGWFDAEHAALGIPFPDVTERMDMLEDAAELLPLVWGPGAPAYSGRTLTVPKAIGYPRPVAGRIPLLIGGGGERRTLRIAAQHADMWNVRSDPAVVKSKRAVVERHCEEVGRNPAELTATVLDITIVGRDRSEVADMVEAARGNRDAADVHRRHAAGTADRHVDRYGDLADLGVRRVYVSMVAPDLRAAVEAFEPVIQSFA